MMKKILFICSHLNSGSSVLFNALDCHPRIQGYNLSTHISYAEPLDLLKLTEQNHKLDNRSSIYMDELLHNHHLSTKVAYNECKFIYVLREPADVLNLLINNHKMKPSFALRYYTYRLRRLCEMAKRTPGAVLLTWDNLIENRGIDLIEKYLNLKQPIFFNPDLLSFLKTTNNSMEYKFISKVEDAYQHYLYYLKNQNILYCS
jgi:hypothetical protein